jgi:hypothetical protein
VGRRPRSPLVEAAKFIDGGPAAGLVLAAGIGQSTAYPDLPFDEILNEAGKAAVAEAKQLCTAELTSRFAFRRINEFTTVSDPLGDPRWLARLEESHAGRRAPGAPVLLYHGTTDEVVPFELGRRLFDDYCALGIPVTWRPLFLHGHIAAGLFGAPGAASWLGNRFEGESPASSC